MEEQGILVFHLELVLCVLKHLICSWLYNLFDDQIADDIKGSLSDSLCSTAVQYIDTNGNAAVESIPCKSICM